jgi:EmrB/QacA subfamily drug resistance transporter
VLAIVSLAAFMASLDLFIVNVGFDAIGRDFHSAGITNLSWILNGYAIVYAALLVPLGRLADRYGRKAGFLGGLALFTAASAACAASPSLWPLVACRVLQAFGAAALIPTSLGLLLSATPQDRRAHSVRIWATTGALAAAVGPVVGGLLVATSWRLIFLVNVPVGVLALIAGALVLTDSRDTAASRLPDLAGAGVLAISIGALALGLVEGSSWGWTTDRTLGAFAIALLGIAVFFRRSSRHPSPVVEPALLRIRAFAWANTTSLAFSVAFGANLLLSILWMQQVWHFSALETGLAVAPGPLMVQPFNVVASELARRIGVGRVTALGCIVLAGGIALTQCLVGAHADYVGQMLPGQLIGGAGIGMALPTIVSAATADLPRDRASTGSAVVNMTRQIGIVLGVSVLVALLGTPATYHAAYLGFEHARFTAIGAAILAAFAALGMTPKPTRQEEMAAEVTELPMPVDALQSISDSA